MKMASGVERHFSRASVSYRNVHEAAGTPTEAFPNNEVTEDVTTIGISHS